MCLAFGSIGLYILCKLQRFWFMSGETETCFKASWAFFLREIVKSKIIQFNILLYCFVLLMKTLKSESDSGQMNLKPA